MTSRGFVGRALATMVAVASFAVIGVAPAQAVERSLTCKYEAVYNRAGPESYVGFGSYTGSFTSMTCTSIGDSGVRVLSLAPGSGAASGQYATFSSTLGNMMFVSMAPVNVDLTDGHSADEVFKFYPDMELAGGGAGYFAGNATYEPGWGTAFGTANLTNCPTSALGSCNGEWHLTGTFTLPWFH
jgi:hypothetical protein